MENGSGKQIGVLILTAVVVIVGVILLQSAAQNVGSSTNTVAIANQTLDTAITNGTSQYITNCKVLTSPVVFNATGNVEIPSSNWTITNNVVYNGQEAVQVLPNACITAGCGFNKGLWKVSGTCQPVGYIPDGGSRSVAGIIVIFFALAVAVVALWPTIKEMGNFR